MNVSLTPTLEAFVKDRVESGLYNNASEVIREALRDSIQKQQGTRMQAEALVGLRELESGKTVNVTSKDQFLNLARGKK